MYGIRSTYRLTGLSVGASVSTTSGSISTVKLRLVMKFRVLGGISDSKDSMMLLIFVHFAQAA